MLQYAASLSHRWLAILASCVLSIVMLISVMPPSARSDPAAGGIVIAPLASSLSVDPSKSVTHTFTVTNNTGAYGVFTLTVSGNQWLTQIKANGVVTDQLTLVASNSATVEVSVTAALWPGGTAVLPYERDVVTLTVVAHSNPSISATAQLTTTRSTYSLTLAAPIYAKSGGLGTAVNYLTHVTNTGNVADVFRLTVVGNWTATISGSATALVSLSAFSGTDINVVVNIPLNAPEGSSDVTTLTATSHGKPTLTTRATFTTTGRTVKVYLPIVLHDWPPPPPPQWMQGSGDITNKTVYQIAVCPAGSRRLLYAGTNTGVYTSTDPGSSWSPTSLSGVLVRGVAVNPAKCDEAYAFAWGRGVMKTTDGGVHWTPVNTGLGELYGYSVVVDPSHSQTIYAGTDTLGVYISSTTSTSWSPTAVTGSVADPTGVFGLTANDSGAVYVATYEKGIYLLQNSGKASLNGDLPLDSYPIYAVAEVNPTVLLAATKGGLYRTSNGGVNWGAVIRSADAGRIYSVYVDPDNKQIVYAGSELRGVLRSGDGGQTFTAYNDGLPTTTPTVRSVTIGPVNAGKRYLYAGTFGQGIWLRQLP